MLRTATKTLAAIDANEVARQEEPHRRHLGASIIGKDCSRKLWYTFRWTLTERFDGRMLRLFNRGHNTEARFVGWLRELGVEIWETDEKGNQWRISDVYGHFGGSCDGVGRGLPDLPPKEPFLCEFKTYNDKQFKRLKEEGLMRAKWEHFVQMQVYMFKLKLRHGVYFAINKNDDELFIEIITADEREAQRAIDRAKLIIESPVPLPRIGDKPSAWQCKFCHYQRLCHFGDVIPERNCRTCIHSRPAENGLWVCTHEVNYQAYGDNVPLDEAAQRKGCELYDISPAFQGRQP